MKKILIAESLDERILEEIQANSMYQVDYQPDISSRDIEKSIVGYHALVVRPKEVSAAIIAAGVPNLSLIVRGGAGVNSIDLEAARKHNVTVLNTPGQNSVATAEFTFALIMELLACRNIHQNARDVRVGNSQGPKHYGGRELKGKSLAIMGFGNIGKYVARYANAFEMEVYACSRSLTEAQAHEHNVTYAPSLEALLDMQADVIALHTPQSSETIGMINDDAFGRMKQGTILVNTARPGLIEPDSFREALANGTLGSFAIDGDPEPIAPFIEADPEQKGIITDHIADATGEAISNITRQVWLQIEAFFEQGKAINKVV